MYERATKQRSSRGVHTIGSHPSEVSWRSFPLYWGDAVSSRSALQGEHDRSLAFQGAATKFSCSIPYRRRLHILESVTTSNFSTSVKVGADASRIQQTAQVQMDLQRAKEDLLATLDSFRENVDRGTLYILESVSTGSPLGNAKLRSKTCHPMC